MPRHFYRYEIRLYTKKEFRKPGILISLTLLYTFKMCIMDKCITKSYLNKKIFKELQSASQHSLKIVKHLSQTTPISQYQTR